MGTEKRRRNYRLVKWLLVVGLLVTVLISTAYGCRTATGCGTAITPTLTPTPTPTTTPVEQVTFPDSNLEAAIREVLNKPEGSINKSDLESLTTLEARERGISDLTGLEYCVNLRSLDLIKNNIYDISPLASLTNLEVLWLSDNNISSIAPLIYLTNLKWLRIDGNNVEGICNPHAVAQS